MNYLTFVNQTSKYNSGACTPDNISTKNMSIDNDMNYENVVTEIGQF